MKAKPVVLHCALALFLVSSCAGWGKVKDLRQEAGTHAVSVEELAG